MPHYRFYTPDNLNLHENVTLEEEEARHLIRVMRASEGDHVELINGRGILAHAHVKEIKKNSCILVVDKLHKEVPSPHSLVLLQGLPKINRLDTILEKATELGVNEILLFPGERSEKEGLSVQQTLRAHAILIAATKQSGRLFLPKISLLPEIGSWPKMQGALFYGDVRPQATRLWDALQKTREPNIHFCIGPEAGLSEHEIMLLEEKGFLGVSLHYNILRTDTAPIAALAIISHYLQSSTGYLS
ncbi:MAG: RsmE family RNA methyltransferase [Parachlamydiales bacterium]|jgi:16S rRNA (uracil1498-N3)-methyltransferase